MADVADKPVDETVTDAAEKPAAESDVAEEAKEEVEKVDEEKAEDEPKKNGDAKVEKKDGTATKKQLEIIRQVEYYFGDANLNRDKFLLEQISKDAEGWVPLSVLLTFKRLSSLAGTEQAVAEALVFSDEGLVAINEDSTKVRRHPERPIPEHNEERRKEIMSRTAYVKGFPLETEMSELIEFFAPYEKVLNINMRKYHDKPTKTYKFKGSVFVTFENAEQTKALIEKEKVMFQERELLRKWQDKYLEDKKEEQKNKGKKNKGKAAETEKLELPKGTVLFFEGANDQVTRELLREAVQGIKAGEYEIAYVEYSKGEKDGHIRFQEENIAAKFIDELTEKKLKVSDSVELACRLLTEEEERVFLEKAVEHMQNRRNHQQKNKGGHHNNRKGGHKRKGGGYNNRNEEKRKRTEAAE